MNLRSFLLVYAALLPVAAGAVEEPSPFEIRDGDRVLLLGDTLLERENTYGYLETRMHEQFPDRKFTVRNLAWAGDTPKGWARASFDGPEKGWERLKEQIALVKPTVVFLGYGMAASLQEMTDRSRDWRLNPDPARYGAKPYSAERFKKELGELMDEIEGNRKAANAVRFVLLSPIRPHEAEDRAKSAMHRSLIEKYAQVTEELAKTRGAKFVDLTTVGFGPKPQSDDVIHARTAATVSLTDNGIHWSEEGHRYAWSIVFENALGWTRSRSAIRDPQSAILPAVRRKNDLFFHRFRPANSTYLFGFRKHEQGQNAKEIPQFDPLIEQAEAEIDRIKRGGSETKAVAKGDASAERKPEPLPVPQFDVLDGYQIELWAADPQLGKPTQMAWDSLGRLWVSCTPIYPQIEPGAHPDDKIVILEDTDRDGQADKTTVFADDLLIPTGVAPDLVSAKDGSVRSACYVGASTELLRLEDTDGDGKADERRVVLSGFGTEDTHHTIHTLRWGPDGRLYFNQSVYIHSHLETPWGIVRLNAGGVFAYDPRTERVEVFSKGLWNPWGLAWDRAGQSFLTDGAGSNGVSWAFPGAIFHPSEGARQTMPSISPGSYPKFCGLELIDSAHFPEDWQGQAVTCDFRAHRLVRFKINDLGQGDEPKSGYVTEELPDLVRTSDVAFRPIDVRLGPDGALYVADWTNPVINHGEVDFRDPRRDKTRGRIWRITRQDAAVKWEPQKANATQNTRSPGPIDRPAPRLRIEAMRRFAAEPKLENVAQVLDTAVQTPAGDPYYAQAAWRSVNDLAEVWVEAVLQRTWRTAGKEKQLEYALGAIEPALATKVLDQLLTEQEVPADGSGPWIELLGRSGSEAQLSRLFARLERQEFQAPVAARVLRAFVEATRVRDARPKGDLQSIAKWIESTDPEISSEMLRLIGLWKLSAFVPAIQRKLSDENATVREAALNSLRDIGGSQAIAVLSELCREQKSPALRRQAVAALATVDLKSALPQIAGVLKAQTAEADLLDTWRRLLGVKDAGDALAGAMPSDLSKEAAAAGVRVAREQGKKGEKLAAALAPIARIDLAATAPPADYTWLVDRARRDGDPGRGEEIYRRGSLACVTCHAIGGAGGKVGPELGTIGASAPLDYIIESLVAPAAKVKEGYHAVTVTLKDGSMLTGVLARETSDEVIVRNAVGIEQKAAKANITAKENMGSIMPAGLIEQLKDREKIDLYAFLAVLGKAGVYDASKGTVARSWWLYSAKEIGAAGIGGLTGGAPAPVVFPNVDGRLPRERLSESLALLGDSESVIAVAKFTATSAVKTKLQLLGVREAWLDGTALPVASEPSLPIDATAGEHVLAVKIDAKHLPEFLSASADGVRFLTE